MNQKAVHKYVFMLKVSINFVFWHKITSGQIFLMPFWILSLYLSALAQTIVQANEASQALLSH